MLENNNEGIYKGLFSGKVSFELIFFSFHLAMTFNLLILLKIFKLQLALDVILVSEAQHSA